MSFAVLLKDEQPIDVGLHGEYLPSPDEIRRQCAAIRNEWSEKERRSRSADRIRAWTVPVFKTARWQ